MLLPIVRAEQSAYRLLMTINVPVETFLAADIELQVSPACTVYKLAERHGTGAKAKVFT